MLIEVDTGNYSYVIKLNKEIINYFSKNLPFNTVIHVWKEEIYFETPITLLKEPNVYSVKLGRVYYWPPGKALCLFYGVSEPYTPVTDVGLYVGVLDHLRKVNEGAKAVVKKHEINKEFVKYIGVLNKLGYETATPLINGERNIVATKTIDEIRASFIMYIEEYGLHLESEPLFNYEDSIKLRVLTEKLKSLVKGLCKYSRVDLNEEMKMCVTATSNRVNELQKVVTDFEKAFTVTHKAIHSFLT